MLTKTDLSKLEEKFATKNDLESGVKSLKDIIVEFKDAILHEIQGLR